MVERNVYIVKEGVFPLADVRNSLEKLLIPLSEKQRLNGNSIGRSHMTMQQNTIGQDKPRVLLQMLSLQIKLIPLTFYFVKMPIQLYSAKILVN